MRPERQSAQNREAKTMKKSVNALVGASIAAILFLAGHASAATYQVDLDAFTGNTVELALAAGTYEVTPVNDPNEAWNAWSKSGAVEGCDGSGENCTKGFIHQYTVVIGGVSTLVQGGGKYSTAAAAFANASPFTFSIANPQQVGFLIFDTNYSDNSGGVSLSVSQVPLPAAAWLFLSAIAGMAGVKRAKRSKATSVLA